MDYTTLKNRVFEKYYFNSYLPGSIGGNESSVIFNYLLSLESIQENLTNEIDISEAWVDTPPTWYTSSLPDLFFIPKFFDESDQDYIDRLILLSDINQNEETIINAVFSVIRKGIISISDIAIIDKLEGVSAVWDGEFTIGLPEITAEWDGTSVWSSSSNVQRTLFLVDIQTFSRGSNIDSTTWDYWILSQNFTKIEDMVNLYKPPGSTFEIRINLPIGGVEVETTIFSNTLID